MIPNIVKGRGISGALAYALGQGNDPETGERRELAPGEDSRAEIIGGQNFGFAIDSPERLELARKIMEWAALPQNQASQTKKCVKDALHMSLSWEAGQTPDRDEMERAAKSALKALGMEGARAVFIAHHDTTHKHMHIIASRIDPATGRTFSDTDDMRKAQAWGLSWERENNQVSAARKELHGIVDAVAKRDVAAILDHMTERQATFTAKELDRALSYGMPDKDERAKFRLEVLADHQAIGLRETAEAAVTRYTTRNVLGAEREVMRAAAQLDERDQFKLSDRRLASVASKATLSAEQNAALRHAAGAGGFAMIAGEAGTGKSRTLGAIRDGYEAQGFRVLGLSWTNAVVQDMRADGFKEASTIAAELKRQEGARARQWDSKTVLMVDEAAMLSTKNLAAVMAKAAAGGAKVILAGDDKQLESIERGGMFRPLADAHGAAELKDVRRTQDRDQQRAFNLMHEGEFAPALNILAAKGALHWRDTQRDALRGVAEKYAADIEADPSKRRFIFAYTNADVGALNHFARELARHHGRIGDDVTLQTADGPAAFAKGDRIQFTGNAADRQGKNAGLVNGAVGVVRSIEAKDARQIVTVELDGKAGDHPRTVSFAVGADKAAGEFNTFRHGYAGTIYKGQGRTLDQSYVYHSQHWRAASAYVALTRHRESVAIFAARETAKDQDDLARQMARDEQRRAASSFFAQGAENQIVRSQHLIVDEREAFDREYERFSQKAQRDFDRAWQGRDFEAGFAAWDARHKEAQGAKAGATQRTQQHGARRVEQTGAAGRVHGGIAGATAAARVADGMGRAMGVAIETLSSVLESLLGGGPSHRPQEQTRAQEPPPQTFDPHQFSETEREQRRAALAQKFGADLQTEDEQVAATTARLRRESGQQQR